jgi:hypothetical protein
MKTSHIWEKGFEVIHVNNESKHYYCRPCLNEKINPKYKLLIVNGISTLYTHFRSVHDFDKSRKKIKRGNSTGDGIATPGPVDLVFKSTLERFRLLTSPAAWRMRLMLTSFR